MAHYEDRFRLAVENAVVGFLIEEPTTGRILEANQAAAGILGRTVDDLVGLSWLDITFPEDREPSMRELERLRCGDATVVSQRKRYVTSDGHLVWVDTQVTSVRDASGRSRYNIAQVRDASVEVLLSDLVWLVSDMPSGDVLCGFLRAGLRNRIGAEVVAVYAMDVARSELALVGSDGWDGSEVASWSRFALDAPALVCHVAQTLSPAFLRIRNVPEVFPFACQWASNHPHRAGGEVVAFPVRIRGMTFGVMYMEVAREFDRSWQKVNGLESIASVIALWLATQREELVARNPVVKRRSAAEVSDRQRTIVRMVRDGLTNRVIADHLGYSEATVRADLQHLSRMLGANGRRDLATRAQRAGL